MTINSKKPIVILSAITAGIDKIVYWDNDGDFILEKQPTGKCDYRIIGYANDEEEAHKNFPRNPRFRQ